MAGLKPCATVTLYPCLYLYLYLYLYPLPSALCPVMERVFSPVRINS